MRPSVLTRVLWKRKGERSEPSEGSVTTAAGREEAACAGRGREGGGGPQGPGDEETQSSPKPPEGTVPADNLRLLW